MNTIYINGQAFSSNDVQIVYGGVPLRTVRSITHGLTKDSEPLFGMGSADAVAFGSGKNNIAWSIEALESELSNIRTSLGAGNFTEAAPLTLSIIHVNASSGPVTPKMYSCICTSDTGGGSNTDKGLYTTISGFAVGREFVQ